MAEEFTGQHEFKDITLICKECGESFIFSASDQRFYAKQGFLNVPVRCKRCREAFQKKKLKGAEVYHIKCKKCGTVGKILTKPTYPQEVYCESCFLAALAAERQARGSLPTSLAEALPLKDSSSANVNS